MKTKWSCIPLDKVNKPSQMVINGVTVDSMAAYFDVPSATRFSYDEGADEFVIDLRYLTDAEHTKQIVHDNISMAIGKNTQRIYQIRMKGFAMKNKRSDAITFSTISKADNIFKSSLDFFKGLNKPNSEVVEKCLAWGIRSKQLNLVAAN